MVPTTEKMNCIHIFNGMKLKKAVLNEVTETLVPLKSTCKLNIYG